VNREDVMKYAFDRSAATQCNKRALRVLTSRSTSLAIIAGVIAASMAAPSAAGEDPSFRQARHTGAPIASLHSSPAKSSDADGFAMEPLYVPAAGPGHSVALPAATLHAAAGLPSRAEPAPIALLTRIGSVPEPGFLLLLGSAFVFLARRLRRRETGGPAPAAH
jgi:hypothetical protein